MVISRMVSSGYKQDLIRIEIEKCDVGENIGRPLKAATIP
jgi:hypothetical protein